MKIKDIEKNIKKQTQVLLENLSDFCLEDSENYREYTDKDLYNATRIFMYILMDKIYTANKLGKEEKEEFVHTIGKELRAFIIKTTGKDMHKIAKDL